MPQRWCIYIDILGFSKLWKREMPKAANALGELMKGIYRIGTKVYPEAGERLFVHHMGDGFAIVSDHGEPSLERALSIATALMRHMASTGIFASSAVAEGDFADITSCYPQEVTEHSKDARMVPLGDGLMTLSSVMGTAFISAYQLHNALSGPLLTVHEKCRERISCDHFDMKDMDELWSVDWIRSTSPLTTSIQQKCDLFAPTPDEIIQAFKDYCSARPYIRRKWRDNLRDLLAVRLDDKHT